VPKANSQLSILVIDDVDEMRLTVEQLIGFMKRFKVSGSCGSTAQARLELTRRRPSLVLLDEVLPGESSLDFLSELVSEGIPVVLMTSLENPTHALPAGARLRIVKPGWKSLEEDAVRIEAQLLAVMA
jgi:two-component system LytT family response regulator